MSRPVLLNPALHRELRVLPGYRAAWGDDVMSALVVPAELRSVQAYYPVVFQKSADGLQFQPVALLGLREGQNLFLNPAAPGGWDVPYVPLSLLRQPFMIGRAGDELMVQVDLDSPRVGHPGSTEGEALFGAHGGPSEFLERATSTLLALHEGLQAVPAFAQALQSHGLLESFVLDVEQADGSQNRLAGLYTVNEDRLAALDGAALADLNAAGHLQPLYMVVASLAHFRDLIERQNRRNAGQR